MNESEHDAGGPFGVFKFPCQPVNLAKITGALLPTRYSYPYCQCPILETETEAEPGQGSSD